MKYKIIALFSFITLFIASATPTQAVAPKTPDPILVVHVAHTEPLKPLPAESLVELDKLAEMSVPTPPPAAAAPQPVAVPVSYAAPTGDDAFYKSFIYAHESGNDPTRYNSSGCLGLGQACPAGKLLAVCPSMDYACEDQWFSGYAVRAYGSWAGAYQFWLSHSWW